MKTLALIKLELLPVYIAKYGNTAYSHEDILNMVDKAAQMIYNSQDQNESVVGNRGLLQE